MPTRVGILSRSFTSRCTSEAANPTNLGGNYREKVEGKQCDPLQDIMKKNGLQNTNADIRRMLAERIEEFDLAQR
jgi:hypothetical protein